MTQVAKSRKQAELIKAATVARVYDKSGNVLGYLVKSNTTDEYYQVTYNSSKHCYECNCTAGSYGKPCCHKKAVKEVVQARRELLASYEVEQQVEEPAVVLSSPDIVTLADAMEVAQARMNIHIDQVAAQAEAENLQKLANYKVADAYEQLGSTRKVAVQEPDSCCYCGQRCKGGVCGRCAA